MLRLLQNSSSRSTGEQGASEHTYKTDPGGLTPETCTWASRLQGCSDPEQDGAEWMDLFRDRSSHSRIWSFMKAPLLSPKGARIPRARQADLSSSSVRLSSPSLLMTLSSSWQCQTPKGQSVQGHCQKKPHDEASRLTSLSLLITLSSSWQCQNPKCQSVQCHCQKNFQDEHGRLSRPIGLDHLVILLAVPYPKMSVQCDCQKLSCHEHETRRFSSSCHPPGGAQTQNGSQCTGCHCQRLPGMSWLRNKVHGCSCARGTSHVLSRKLVWSGLLHLT